MLLSSTYLLLISTFSHLSHATATQFPLAISTPSPDSPFHVFQSEHSADHIIRLQKQNASLCNTNVTQYTGWLDVGHVHLFFWYFASEAMMETEEKVTDAPLMLWMTGGPGGSSLLGMLQELGPCLINKHGNGTDYNPYGWNKDTALLFVDQPAGVGFSYVDEGTPVPDNSFIAAHDMHLFLQMFVSQVFPEHKDGDFHISGESYAGHYIPTLGSQIIIQNGLFPRRAQVNLKSVLIGNGYVSPLDTAFGYWETLCTTNPGVPKPVFNETRCDFMAEHLPRCLELARVCYDHPDPDICAVASTVCWNGVVSLYDSESGAGGRNRFDITAPCELDGICYPQAAMLEKYLNTDFVFSALHVPSNIKNYSISSEDVADAFQLTNDIEISTETQVRFLLESQIDVLLYQGNLDLACNTAGNLRWSNSMSWTGAAAYSSQPLIPWQAFVEGKKIDVGKFKEVKIRTVKGSEKRTRFAFVTVERAGHLVPQDQPVVALEMVRRWLGRRSWA